MSLKFKRTLAATAAVAGLSGCASAPAEHRWVNVKPVHTTAQSDLTGIDGEYGAAVAAIGRRDYALALDLLQTANAQKRDDVRVLNAFGVVYDKLGRFDLSSRYYARAHTADASSPIVAANQAYSAALQGQYAQPPATPARALAAASPPAPAAVTAVAQLSPAPLVEAPRAANLAIATPVVFHTAQPPAIRPVAPPSSPAANAPVFLPAAAKMVATVTLAPAPVAEAPRAPALALAKPSIVRSAASLKPLQSFAQFQAPTAPTPEPRVASAAVIWANAPPVRMSPAPLTLAPHALALASPTPIVLRAIAQPGAVQPGVVRLAAISPTAVRMLPAARRPGVEIADASGRGGMGAPIRLQLARLGWTTQKGAIAQAPRASRTTITYAAYRAPVALSLARTLPRGVRMVDCGTACGGIRLTLGTDSLAWPARFRAFVRSFG